MKKLSISLALLLILFQHLNAKNNICQIVLTPSYMHILENNQHSHYAIDINHKGDTTRRGLIKENDSTILRTFKDKYRNDTDTIQIKRPNKETYNFYSNHKFTSKIDGDVKYFKSDSTILSIQKIQTGKYIERTFGETTFTDVEKLHNSSSYGKISCVEIHNSCICEDESMRTSSFMIGDTLFSNTVAKVKIEDITKETLKNILSENMQKLSYIYTKHLKANNFKTSLITHIFIDPKGNVFPQIIARTNYNSEFEQELLDLLKTIFKHKAGNTYIQTEITLPFTFNP